MRKSLAPVAPREHCWTLAFLYDYGVEINAFAKCFATFSQQASLGRDEVITSHVHNLFDHYLTVYMGANSSQDTYREKTRSSPASWRSSSWALRQCCVSLPKRDIGIDLAGRQLCEVMLNFEHIHEGLSGQPEFGFKMGIALDSPVYVDCHSAALLALTHAARHLDDPRLAAAIDRGLGIYTLATNAILLNASSTRPIWSRSVGSTTRGCARPITPFGIIKRA